MSDPAPVPSPSPTSPARWQRGEPRLLSRTRILDLTSVPFHHPRRDVKRDFVIIDAPDWVNVIAHTHDEHLVLVNQFRYGANAFSWEIPGGVIEHGEDPVAAGQRELLEETGYAGEGARLLASIHPNPAIMSNRCHLVLVENCRLVSPMAWDPDEEIEVALVPTEEVFARARAGGITHSLVLDGLFFFEAVWREMKAKSAGPASRAVT
jgi:8-oxo-dGTP pyrophosphatase MutT (NUDIX family)